MFKLVVALILFFSASNLSAQVTATYFDGDIKIDGDLSDWTDATWGYFVPADSTWIDTCLFTLRWNREYLYLAFIVRNSNLQAEQTKRDAPNLYKDDGVEFLIDANFDHTDEWKEDDIAYHINILNAILDERGVNEKGGYNGNWSGKALTQVSTSGTINKSDDEDKGYLIEVAVPWTEIGKVPSPGLTLGIDLCVNDRDDITQQYRHYDLMNLPKFHVPSGFAKLMLVK